MLGKIKLYWYRRPRVLSRMKRVSVKDLSSESFCLGVLDIVVVRLSMMTVPEPKTKVERTSNRPAHYNF